MFQIRRLGWFLLAVVSTCAAAEHCSLTVQVNAVRERSYPVKIVVEENNGRRVFVEAISSDPVAICDLGILPVKVVVGGRGCAQVVVSDVPLVWNVTRRLVIGYDDRSCNTGEIPVAACKLLLRFVDQKGRPLPSTVFRMEKPRSQVLTSDIAGRLLVIVGVGADLRGLAQFSGASTVVSYPCYPFSDVKEIFVNVP